MGFPLFQKLLKDFIVVHIVPEIYSEQCRIHLKCNIQKIFIAPSTEQVKAEYTRGKIKSEDHVGLLLDSWIVFDNFVNVKRFFITFFRFISVEWNYGAKTVCK